MSKTKSKQNLLYFLKYYPQPQRFRRERSVDIINFHISMLITIQRIHFNSYFKYSYFFILLWKVERQIWRTNPCLTQSRTLLSIGISENWTARSKASVEFVMMIQYWFCRNITFLGRYNISSHTVSNLSVMTNTRLGLSYSR